MKEKKTGISSYSYQQPISYRMKQAIKEKKKKKKKKNIRLMITIIFFYRMKQRIKERKKKGILD